MTANIFYAVGFGLSLGALVYGLVWAVQEWTAHWRSKRRRSYDWQLDGECHNASYPRVLP